MLWFALLAISLVVVVIAAFIWAVWIEEPKQIERARQAKRLAR